MTAILMNTLPDTICIYVISIWRGNALSKWLYAQRAGRSFRLWTSLGGYIYECTTIYDLQRCNVEFTWNAPLNDWTHSRQVWVSGYKRYWNNEMMAIYINTLPDMICIDVIWTLRGMPPKMIGYGQQVWVSGYKRYWDNGMTAIFINTLPGIICIEVMSALRGMPLKMIGYSQQVWVSAYKRYWNIQMTAIFMNTLPDTICIEVN